MDHRIITSNIILYCRRWPETVAFYRDSLGLPIRFSTHWFVEFVIAGQACLSVADEAHASVKSGSGRGVTVSLQVEDIDLERHRLLEKGLTPGSVKDHPWNARVFYITDPEGHRIEFWQKRAAR